MAIIFKHSVSITSVPQADMLCPLLRDSFMRQISLYGIPLWGRGTFHHTFFRDLAAALCLAFCRNRVNSSLIFTSWRTMKHNSFNIKHVAVFTLFLLCILAQFDDVIVNGLISFWKKIECVLWFKKIVR